MKHLKHSTFYGLLYNALETKTTNMLYYLLKYFNKYILPNLAILTKT